MISLKKNKFLSLSVVFFYFLIVTSACSNEEVINKENNQLLYKKHIYQNFLLNNSKIINDISDKLNSSETEYVKGVSKASLQFLSDQPDFFNADKYTEKYLDQNTLKMLNESIGNYEDFLLQVYNFTYDYAASLTKEDGILVSKYLKKVNDDLFIGRTTEEISSQTLSIYNMYAHPESIIEKYDNKQLREIIDEFNSKIIDTKTLLNDLENKYDTLSR